VKLYFLSSRLFANNVFLFLQIFSLAWLDGLSYLLVISRGIASEPIEWHLICLGGDYPETDLFDRIILAPVTREETKIWLSLFRA